MHCQIKVLSLSVMRDIWTELGSIVYVTFLVNRIYDPYNVCVCRILDDSDLFETQRSFKSSDFAEITMFLNNCIFHAIWMEEDLAQLSHCRELLSLLYYRDCKQHFCHKEHWHIRLVFVSVDAKLGHLAKTPDMPFLVSG